MPPLSMTIPLWTLAAFVAWTLFVLLLLLAARVHHLSQGGSTSDFGRPDETKLIWRLFRVHSNCIENLPLFAGVVLIISLRDVGSTAIDTLSITYFLARLSHSIVHIFGWDPRIRFAFLLFQIVCLLGLLSLAVTA